MMLFTATQMVFFNMKFYDLCERLLFAIPEYIQITFRKAPFHINMDLAQIQGCDSHFEIYTRDKIIKMTTNDSPTIKVPRSQVPLAFFWL